MKMRKEEGRKKTEKSMKESIGISENGNRGEMGGKGKKGKSGNRKREIGGQDLM